MGNDDRPNLKRFTPARLALICALIIAVSIPLLLVFSKSGRVDPVAVKRLISEGGAKHDVEIVRLQPSTILAPDGRECPVIYAWTKDDQRFMAIDLKVLDMDLSELDQIVHYVTRKAYRSLSEAEPGRFVFEATEEPPKELASVGFGRLIYSIVSDEPDNIWRVAAEGDTTGIERLLAAGADIDAKDPAGSTPLIIASAHGHDETAKWLIENGVEIDATSMLGDTALHAAAFLCHSELTALLIEKGADVNHKNNRGETPLDTVTRKWNQSLRDLYAGSGALLQMELDIARIERVRPKVAELIRKNGGEQNPDLDVFTAASTGHSAIVEKYLAAGNDIEAKGPLGCRLLLHAAALGQTDIVKLLIENGAELDAQDGQWPTALALAADFCQREVVELLLEKGADPSLKVTAGGGIPGGQTALESVTEPWSEEMAGGYLTLGAIFHHSFDLERIERDRPKMANLLRQTDSE